MQTVGRTLPRLTRSGSLASLTLRSRLARPAPLFRFSTLSSRSQNAALASELRDLRTQVRAASTAAALKTNTAPDAAASENASAYQLTETDVKRLKFQRNIGVSAHIDSGKTTLTERVLYYTGRINDIHEVRGKDSVGAKMDSMDLEREKGITIQSAATFCDWEATSPTTGERNKYAVNIIDTPGHVDFTIEVERALRVLDGAILVLCAVAGVQSQTTTVDRQMRRYGVPRISFINKMDRPGANPWRVINQIRQKLKIAAAAVQVPIVENDELKGVVDLVRWKAIYNEGHKGIDIVESDDIPASTLALAQRKRTELLEQLAEVDDAIGDALLCDEVPSPPELAAAIRRATVSLRFSPVFMGSAIKNTAVQPLLDGVCAYLASPAEARVVATDTAAVESGAAEEGTPEAEVELVPAAQAPLVGLAFKLEEGRFGQLTYMRVYQGTLRKGGHIYNAKSGKKVKVPRLVRMHSNEMEDIESIGPGEICAIFGVECSSGDTFTDGSTSLSMTPMFVPDPVISLAVKPAGKETPNFSRALNRFQKEDPTFRVHLDPESKETIISGMGELHLEIYVERMRREYNVECTTGKPRVAFRETITQRAEFAFTHKKQTGGQGQFARISGYIEPLYDPNEGPSSSSGSGGGGGEAEGDGGDKRKMAKKPGGGRKDAVFENDVMGGTVPSNFIPAIEKGFYEALEKGTLSGNPITNARFVLQDGAYHAVDSSELAFRLCTIGAIREVYAKTRPAVLEPIMSVEVVAPAEFQAAVIGGLNSRRGTIVDSEVRDEEFTCTAEVALNEMFGYSGQLRGQTQGKGEFSMEYRDHRPVLPPLQREMEEAYKRSMPQAKK
ncbi:elongation factor G mitochondrial, partial [Coniophora puteana RWD-64-598 SS2]